MENAVPFIFRGDAAGFLQMPEHLPREMAARKGDGQLARVNLHHPVCIRLIKTGVTVNFVKVIDAQVVIR